MLCEQNPNGCFCNRFGKDDLPVAATTVSVISISGISWWVISWRRAIIRWSTMSIDVWVSWRVIATIRIIKTSTTWWWVIIDRTTRSRWWRTTITTTVIIIIRTTRWASIAIGITSRTITSGWTTSIIIINGVRSSSRHWGSRSSTITRDIRLGLFNVVSIIRKRLRWRTNGKLRRVN